MSPLEVDESGVRTVPLSLKRKPLQGQIELSMSYP